ncbi:MAG: UDP-N-acetylmuramoyl-L-alanyl-D-glutamate--2,6-diaminopimelate ligase [Mycoplasmatota bacterium]|nr:UDP-N-acetylmuramoyl-L-alanyl-D-glutamate--2,6-diaminopimelate ligase [Mycoplasmatota bacterium]
MKKLNEIVDCEYDIDIIGVADDSRNVSEGYLFVATKGYYVDHFDYIEDAINNGAVAVIVDRNVKLKIPTIVVEDINDYYFEVCKRFYDVSPSDFSFIGITGTDGKTTTATVVSQLLNKVELCAYIGTNGVQINDSYYPTTNTTPCVGELFKCLKFIKERNCKLVVMEVSSEALLHERLKGFNYDMVAYTNITEDHLNIHKTIDNYRECKFKLLSLLKPTGIVIINGDDNNCRMIDSCNLHTFGINSDNEYVISNVNEMSNSVKFNLCTNENKYEIVSPLKGQYNVYNVAMAFVICLLKGMNPSGLIDEISKLKVVKGRREYLDFGQDFDIILDYAHTYNGIKCLLESVKNYKKIITITGAAGGREVEKRSKIGKLILDKSTIAIFTMDDPRYEDVNDIIDQMVSSSEKNYIRIVDRKTAIFKGLELADKESVVLVIGKGRDNYMAIENRREEYSDYESIKNFFIK